MSREQANQESFRALLSALGRIALDEIDALISDDAVFEFPFASAAPRSAGREAVLTRLRDGYAKRFKGMNFTIDAIYDVAGEDAVFAEYRSEASLHDGSHYSNQYVGLLRLRGGKIVLFREYYNSPRTSPAPS